MGVGGAGAGGGGGRRRRRQQQEYEAAVQTRQRCSGVFSWGLHPEPKFRYVTFCNGQGAVLRCCQMSFVRAIECKELSGQRQHVQRVFVHETLVADRARGSLPAKSSFAKCALCRQMSSLQADALFASKCALCRQMSSLQADALFASKCALCRHMSSCRQMRCLQANALFAPTRVPMYLLCKGVPHYDHAIICMYVW